jgi:hypothetical protein
MTKEGYLKEIARETAKMSWPGEMNNIVVAGTKAELEKYFTGPEFPIEELWDGTSIAYIDYEKWHKGQTQNISKHVVVKTDKKPYVPVAVSAKFLNTFMHQLMKYEKFRGFYELLHLPLDSRVIKHKDIKKKCEELKITNAYTIDYDTYKNVQEGLKKLLEDYTEQLESAGIKLRSRIDLNAVLWAGESKGKKSKN